MLRQILTSVAAVVSASTPAFATDASANFVTRLFIDVCIPNVGRPENVRAWALDRKLAEVRDPLALNVFAGEGDRGAAWALPTSYGSFALAIRGKTQACAVYARAADPADVEAYFKRLLEGAARPGLVLKTVEDTTAQGSTGTIHTLIYSVSNVGQGERGNLYTLQTLEKAGGAFQASLQVVNYDNASPSR
jgi:hypothetical protein